MIVRIYFIIHIIYASMLHNKIQVIPIFVQMDIEQIQLICSRVNKTHKSYISVFFGEY